MKENGEEHSKSKYEALIEATQQPFESCILTVSKYMINYMGSLIDRINRTIDFLFLHKEILSV